MKKHLFIKKLLVLLVVLITCISTAWGQTYRPAKVDNQKHARGVAMQGAAIQSQQIMTGGAYKGTVYTPFSNTTPSEASSPAKAPGRRKAGWYDENGDYHTDEGEFYTGGEDKPSSQSPIGEPWVMVLFALGFAGVIAIRQYKRKTVKSMDMKNSAGKFVAALALLCTLGVGQMWAAQTYYYHGNHNLWGYTAMTVSADGLYEYYTTSATSNNNFLVSYDNGSGGYGDYTYDQVAQFGFNHTNITNAGKWDGANNICCQDNGASTCYVIVYYPNTVVNTESHPIACASKFLPQTVFWVNSSGNNEDKVMAYTWGGSYSTSGYPGELMTSTGKTYNNKKMYYFTTSGGNIIFSANGDNYKTANLTPHPGKVFVGNSGDDNSWVNYAYDITVTFNANGHGDAPSSQTILTGTAATDPSDPSATGYDFGEWFEEPGCTNQWNFSSTINADKTLYAKWTEQTFNLTFNNDGHGSVSVGGASVSSGSTASVNYWTTKSLAATANNGYQFSSWSLSGSNQAAVVIADKTSTGANTTIRATNTGATVTANFSPKNYTVSMNNHDADIRTGTASVTATFDADDNIDSDITTPQKTGYTFNGYNTEEDGSGVTLINADGEWQTDNDYIEDGGTWIWYSTNTVTLHAQWSANSYTITLDGDEPNKDNAGTRAVSGSATYDASMPAQTGTLPTAANGYHFMGFYSLQNGDGVKVIDEDGNWVASADGYTDASTHWVHADDATLYAYFKKAEVTEIAFTAALVAKETTAEAEITVSPSPVGTTILCFKLLYNSGAELASQPTFTYNAGTRKVTFTAPSTPGSYKLQVTLRTGSSCDGGTMLDTEDESFTVAGPNVVTIKYMYGDTKTEVKASTTVEGDPLNWTEVSVGTASDDPIGYTFSTWELGDGMTLNTEGGYALTDRAIQFKSTYNATLKAKYNKKNLIYFYNNLDWETVYVYFYSNTKEYWAAGYGTGAYKGKVFEGNSPFWDMHYGQMTNIPGTKIWYFDYTARGWDAWQRVAFANMDKANSGTDNTSNNDLGFFANTTETPIQVVRRGDHTTQLPMYVPYNGTYQLLNSSKAKYFFEGYWMNYPENTGYELYIFDCKLSNSDHGGLYLRRIPFEMSQDNTGSLKVKTDLEGNTTYGFKFVKHGSSDTWYGNTGTMSNGHSGDVGQGVWEFQDPSKVTSDCGLTTSSAGNYEFTLTYGEKSSKFYYMVGVKFPEATGDYRVLYKDDNTSGEWFVSHVIPRLLDKDTISFFVRPNAHPKMKMQKCTASWDGSSTTVSWTDTITEATNMLSSIPAAITAGDDGVYYFCMNKGEDGKRVMGDVAAYEGEYYIRTDCAPSQWDNYRNSDHRMTYSEYAEEHNTAPAYTHYYMKYATTGTNVKFVVANDYSPYISDTLKGGDHVNMSSHTLNANANIRFMWDRRNNNVGREFIAPAQNNGSRFLVMQGEAEKLLAPNGTALDGYDEAHPGNNKGGGLNAIQFTDIQDWIYTADVKAVPGGRIKLYKSYDGGTYYVYGDDDASFEVEDSHAIELIGGTGDASAQTIRVIYDFKTNRLMTAWIPADTIKTALTLNADIMIVREHQEAASNIVLNGSGKIDLATGKMIYGVMRFNRYTLNNREKTGAHGFLPIANWKSQYERSLYYISFPFDVKINEIFGMGEYGKQWIMQRYRGDQRAQKGFWIDSGSYWKFMGPDMTLNANEGYILTLDLNKFEYDLTDEGEIWHNGVEEIELYFPASEAVNITQVADFELPALDSTIYKCTINRGDGTDGDRRIKDSYWRCIGVPSFADYSGVVKDSNEVIITWKTDGLPFLYDINWADKSITAYSGTNFPFKAMHAYLIQNGSNIHWYNVYTYQPSPAVGALRRSKEELSELEFRLEINQQDSMIDQTYVRLSEADGVTNEFDFGQDMSKEFNAGANIYTFIGYEQVAGNSMPFSNQTTTVPVGVQIADGGEYTFAMPDGTNGVGVVLVDNVANTRTNLALEDYTINLAAGQYDERFVLEISPIVNTPTSVETVSGDGKKNIRKMMVDGVLYIVRDGKVFDARGMLCK